MEAVINQPAEQKVFKAKWVNVVDIEYSMEGKIRHAYFHPQSERLTKFKEDRGMSRKIISITDTRIPKGVHWIN